MRSSVIFVLAELREVVTTALGGGVSEAQSIESLLSTASTAILAPVKRADSSDAILLQFSVLLKYEVAHAKPQRFLFARRKLQLVVPELL